ncbi:hypothetical protein CHS0354_038654 [Potamilus streckersoni]|uniref:Uncharacterized protein n=1 Tax=Potamilus streckersoni TaxID=2493646 RepID=A0AAE0W7Q9_9BIVA|nr:hypothetical protein CHS0354_038654 [Potamilus streckersoni]
MADRDYEGGETYRGAGGETNRNRGTHRVSERDGDHGPGNVSPHPTDLADDLKVPYEFRTPESPKKSQPPSPPRPFSTDTKNYSNVYAVANPEILRAQGISPPQGQVQFTPRTYGKAGDSNQNAYGVYSGQNDETGELNRASRDYSHNTGVTATDRTKNTTTNQSRNRNTETTSVSLSTNPTVRPPSNPNWGTPVRDRIPTPYLEETTREQRPAAESPPDWGTPRRATPQTGKKSQREQEEQSPAEEGLPPQHPPIDTHHSRKSGTHSPISTTVKRVYVESPSFTKEEEEEYRFVSSRLEDTEDKEDTYRQMDQKIEDGYSRARDRGYPQQDKTLGYSDKQAPGEPRGYGYGYGPDQLRRERDQDAGQRDRGHDDGDRGQINDSRGEGYADRDRDREGDRKRDQGYDRDHRFGDRDKDHKHLRQTEDDERYEDRNRAMNDDQEKEKPQYRNSDRYEDRNAQMQDKNERYENERHEQGRKPQGYTNQVTLGDNIDMDDDELQQELEYQKRLRAKIESNSKHDREIQIPKLPLPRQSQEYVGDSQNFARDSLEYPNEKGWGQPPANPGNNYDRRDQDVQRQRPKESILDLYDPEDTARMELVNPKQPRYDYVEKNKQDYGLPPKKSYKEIKERKKEEEEKLDKIFIQPKVPKPTKKKKSLSAQPEHLGYQAPVAYNDYTDDKPSSAEELWAKRSVFLTRKKEEKLSAGGKSKLKKFPSDSNLGKAQSSLQGIKQQGYGTPTKSQYHLQPLENRPVAPPAQQEPLPPAIEPQSPFRRHHELKPISQEIVTEDGQRISVDINLRLISPPPTHAHSSSQRQSPQQHQLALVPVQDAEEEAAPLHGGRPVGVPYQVNNVYGGYQDNGYAHQDNQGYVPPDNYTGQHGGYGPPPGGYGAPYQGYSGPQGGYTGQGHAMTQAGYAGQGYTGSQGGYASYPDSYGGGPGGYASYNDNTGAHHPPEGHPGEEIGYTTLEVDQTVPSSSQLLTAEDGYAAMYKKNKNKDPNERPWYKIYSLEDYNKMKKEWALNRGTLGPDLDTEDYKDKLEKRHKQFEYARMVMEKNKMDLSDKKRPSFPRKQKEPEGKVKRNTAIEYSKNVPKPAVKPRPNQYNSYEVAAQLAAPSGKTKTKVSSKAPSAKTLDVIDLNTLQQRHEMEKQSVSKIRQNMESVLTQKA